MFARYCPVHGSRVLLTDDHIDDIRQTRDGIDVYYHCTCGHHGVWHTGRRRRRKAADTR